MAVVQPAVLCLVYVVVACQRPISSSQQCEESPKIEILRAVQKTAQGPNPSFGVHFEIRLSDDEADTLLDFEIAIDGEMYQSFQRPRGTFELRIDGLPPGPHLVELMAVDDHANASDSSYQIGTVSPRSKATTKPTLQTVSTRNPPTIRWAAR